MERPFGVALALGVSAVALTACQGHAHPQPPPWPPSPSAVETESSASSHTWPDGFAVRIIGVTYAMGNDQPGSVVRQYAPHPSDAAVTFTLALTNGGTTPVALQKDRYLWRVLTGVNRYEDTNDTPTTGEASDETLVSPVPERVAVGQTVTLFDSWYVPVDQLPVLAVRVDLAGDRMPFTFTDLHVQH